MKNLTKTQMKKKIEEYKMKYQNEIKTHGGITKNAVFYEATINLYQKELGLEPSKKW